MAGLKVSTCIHVQSTCRKGCPPPPAKLSPTRTAKTKASVTEPTPTSALALRGRRGPKSTRIRNPAKGRAGTNHNNPSISPSHLAGLVGIERLEAVIEQQHESQADRYFGGGHRQDQYEHHLTVGLCPAGGGDDE